MKKTWVVLFVVVFTGTVVSISKAANSVSGQETVNGVTCNYYEVKESQGKGPRGIRLCCSDVYKDRKDCTYYGANPHYCGNKYNNNQVRYYKKLALSAMKNGAPCAQKEIEDKICNLIYPCTAGDCLLGNDELKRRRRRSVQCDAVNAVNAVNGAESGTRSIYIAVFVSLLSMI